MFAMCRFLVLSALILLAVYRFLARSLVRALGALCPYLVCNVSLLGVLCTSRLQHVVFWVHSAPSSVCSVYSVRHSFQPDLLESQHPAH